MYTYDKISLHPSENEECFRPKENQNTHFMFNYIFSDSGAFMKSCGKIWYSQTGHTMVPAFCVLNS